MGLAGVISTVTLLALQPTTRLTRLARPAAQHRLGRSGAVRAQSLFASEGGDSGTDWDGEAKTALAKRKNAFFKTIKDIEVPDLISEFAATAPEAVQEAVRTTVRQVLGNMPDKVAAITRESSGTNIASLMFSMQMTGYMFRNAQYRRSLLESIESKTSEAAALPPVTGTIAVEVGGGLTAEVDAAAYMAELRSEVEGLRAQLAGAKEKQEQAAGGLISFMQSLGPEEAQTLGQSVSAEVLEAMGALIDSILREANVQPDAVMKASDAKMRELLVWQLVTGYKLRELEVKEELKDKFWGADAV